MKKLTIAIAVSSVLVSGAAIAGNESTVNYQYALGDSVTVDQSTPGFSEANGNNSFVEIKIAAGNTVDIDQDGERNTSTAKVIGGSFFFFPLANVENDLKIQQTGDDNVGEIIVDGGLSFYNELTIMQDGDGNNSSINVAKKASLNDAQVDIRGDSNTTISSFEYDADNNKLNIDIIDGAHDNEVTTNVGSRGDDNIAGVYINDGANNNMVDVDQDGDDNQSYVTIIKGAYNQVYIDQNGNDSISTVNVTGHSYNNFVDVTQSSNDNSNVNVNWSTGTSTIVTQN